MKSQKTSDPTAKKLAKAIEVLNGATSKFSIYASPETAIQTYAILGDSNAVNLLKEVVKVIPKSSFGSTQFRVGMGADYSPEIRIDIVLTTMQVEISSIKEELLRIGKQFHADESDPVDETLGHLYWRYWWD